MDKNRTPKSVIIKRSENFAKFKPDKIYSLYATGSDFIRFFPTVEDYIEQYQKLSLEHEAISIDIINEKIFESYAEVLYIERFRYDDIIKIFYCKTTLVIEDESWKILNEEKQSSQ